MSPCLPSSSDLSGQLSIVFPFPTLCRTSSSRGARDGGGCQQHLDLPTYNSISTSTIHLSQCQLNPWIMVIHLSMHCCSTEHHWESLRIIVSISESECSKCFWFEHLSMVGRTQSKISLVSMTPAYFWWGATFEHS